MSSARTKEPLDIAMPHGSKVHILPKCHGFSHAGSMLWYQNTYDGGTCSFWIWFPFLVSAKSSQLRFEIVVNFVQSTFWCHSVCQLISVYQAGWVQLLSNDHIPELIQTWIHSVVHCCYVWLHRFFRSKARLQNPELGILFSDQVLWCVGGWTVWMCMDLYECDSWTCGSITQDLCKNVFV